MSQEFVFNVLKKLGGRATAGEIKAEVKKTYPLKHLNTWVSDKLSRLRIWGYIEFVHEKNCGRSQGYYILKQEVYDR